MTSVFVRSLCIIYNISLSYNLLIIMVYKSKTITNHCFLVIVFLFLCNSRLYPKPLLPYENKDLIESSDFEVKVNGSAVFTEHFEVPTPKEPNITDRERNFVTRVYEYIGDMQQIAIARFNAEGSSIIEVRYNHPAAKYKVRPLRDGMTIEEIATGVIKIEMPDPAYIQVDIAGLPSLIIIPEQKPEIDVDITASNVKYFPPRHTPCGRNQSSKQSDNIHSCRGGCLRKHYWRKL